MPVGSSVHCPANGGGGSWNGSGRAATTSPRACRAHDSSTCTGVKPARTGCRYERGSRALHARATGTAGTPQAGRSTGRKAAGRRPAGADVLALVRGGRAVLLLDRRGQPVRAARLLSVASDIRHG